MPYSATTWVDGTTPAISAANLNKIETELARLKVNADLDAAAAIAYSKLNLAASVKSSDLATSVVDAPAGKELAYTEFTAPVVVSVVSEATAATLVTAAAVTFDGVVTATVDFFAPVVEIGTTLADGVVFVLYEDGATIGFFGQYTTPAAAVMRSPVRLTRRRTPASGSRTYSVRAYKIGTGNGNVIAGTGGSGQYQPGFIRIVKV